MKKIRLLLVDDDPLWLKGISSLLNGENDMLVVGAAESREEALKFISNFDIDIILLDLYLSSDKYDGISLAMEILKIKRTKIIILTSFKEKEVIKDAFVAGAVNYFNKDNCDVLPHAIRAAYGNVAPMEILIEDYSRLREENRLNVLTDAERQLYDMKKEGYTLKQISDSMHKSTSTLKKQMNKILKKLGISRFEESKKIL